MKPRGGRSKEQQEVIHRYWSEVPVYEAEHDCRVAVLPEDAEGSTPGDAKNCLLARACKRQFGTALAVFFRTVAYVEIPTETGELRVERFIIPQGARQLIREFDEKKAVREGAAFVLRAPRPSETAEAHRAAQKAHREAIVRGEIEIDLDGDRAVAAREAKKKASTAVVANGTLRSGTGMVQFIQSGNLAETRVAS